MALRAVSHQLIDLATSNTSDMGILERRNGGSGDGEASEGNGDSSLASNLGEVLIGSFCRLFSARILSEKAS
jgi:hypothetical protein